MINFNGTIVSEEDFKLNSENRGYKYGDALFETLKVVNGVIFFWEDHYFRLISSMRIPQVRHFYKPHHKTYGQGPDS